MVLFMLQMRGLGGKNFGNGWQHIFTRGIGYFLVMQNMVDLFDDSIGAFARLHDSKERSWRILVDKLDLIDSYLMVAHIKGFIFTRQAVSGNWLDQSRLHRSLLATEEVGMPMLAS